MSLGLQTRWELGNHKRNYFENLAPSNPDFDFLLVVLSIETALSTTARSEAEGPMVQLGRKCRNYTILRATTRSRSHIHLTYPSKNSAAMSPSPNPTLLSSPPPYPDTIAVADDTPADDTPPTNGQHQHIGPVARTLTITFLIAVYICVAAASIVLFSSSQDDQPSLRTIGGSIYRAIVFNAFQLFIIFGTGHLVAQLGIQDWYIITVGIVSICFAIIFRLLDLAIDHKI